MLHLHVVNPTLPGSELEDWAHVLHTDESVAPVLLENAHVSAGQGVQTAEPAKGIKNQ